MGNLESLVKQHLLAERRELVHKKKMSSALLNDSQVAISKITTDFLGYYRTPDNGNNADTFDPDDLIPIEPLDYVEVPESPSEEVPQQNVTEPNSPNDIPQNRPLSPLSNVSSPSREETPKRYVVTPMGQSKQFQDKMANLGDCVATLRTLTVIEHPPDL